VRFFIDECVSPSLSRHLNQSGLHDSIHPRDRGRLRQPDHVVFTHAVAEDRIIAAGGHVNETFDYEAGFGQSTIKGFAATGASPDVIQFQIAAFDYLNGSTDQQQDATALLSHAVKQGANLEFTDSTGDTLTLANVTRATLSANLGDFRFV
jgi:hypothetical protein